jgi:branched-chain amino acid transport system ATP-binding protein
MSANGAPLLEVSGLNVHYGPAHVLQDVSFEVRDEPVSLIGRNGMGKTTLCNAILQMPPGKTSGSIRFQGTELIGRSSYKIAGAGIGYVPQGRRLFESLTVDEHLKMLAIGRALLTNTKLLIMDEPSEGLAPTIIETLIETFRGLAAEGLAILCVEQNLAMATSMADRQLVMVAGQIAAETTAAELAHDPEAQRRWLGVERG